MRATVATLLALSSCSKVPIYDVFAQFIQADATWFEAEDTMFVFYEVTAEQGIGDPSIIEVQYRTDSELVTWTNLEDLEAVHTHVAVDCGINSLCGSMSFRVPIEPRDVRVRLRYHRDGELALDAPTVFNVVGDGAPHASRSLLVYGVFDETNQRVQWRGRHQFPTLRNQRAEELGLRREFWVDNQRYGTGNTAQDVNPYSYGALCPDALTAVDIDEVRTTERAIFNPEELPDSANPASLVCADSTTTDANGTFTANAFARKNPEVRSPFPELNSPTRLATQLQFFLAPCDRVIDARHEEMQRQRLDMEGLPTYCTDDWRQPNWVATFVSDLREAIESERPNGRDMVVTIGLHRDEDGVADAVEEAMVQVFPDERHRASPRAAGAFLFDSDDRGMTNPGLRASTLWCPATISLVGVPDTSQRSCPLIPVDTTINLGPFSFGGLTVLPSRSQYNSFIDEFGPGQTGEVEELLIRTPEFATTSEHVDFGEFGVVTFLNNEAIDADADDAFSFCVQEEVFPFVFRSTLMENDLFVNFVLQQCATGQLPEEVCAAAGSRLLQLDFLPLWHNIFGENRYKLGVFWEFPFLLQINYRAVLAGSATALGFTVPFGIGAPAEGFFGDALWQLETLPIDPLLTQCRRFCNHPTFDSAGVYHIRDPFRSTYASACYQPRYPRITDSGFPLDP